MKFELHQIMVSRFRHVENLSVQFHPSLTVFTGDSGSGKTSMLDALALGLSAVCKCIFSRHHRRTIAVTDRFTGVNPSDPCSFVCLAFQSTTGLRWDVTKFFSVSQARKFGAQYLSTHHVEATIAAKELEAHSHHTMVHYPMVAVYTTPLDQKIPSVLRTPGDHRLNVFENCVGAVPSIPTLVASLCSLNTCCSGYVMAGICEALRQFDFVGILNPRVARTNSVPSLFVDVNRWSQSVTQSAELLPSGLKRLFVLIVDIARRLFSLNEELHPSIPFAALAAPGVVVIDDVDLHLDPQLQALILPQFIKVFPNIQFIVSTQSRTLLKSVPGESLRPLIRGAQVAVCAAG